MLQLLDSPTLVLETYSLGRLLLGFLFGFMAVGALIYFGLMGEARMEFNDFRKRRAFIGYIAVPVVLLLAGGTGLGLVVADYKEFEALKRATVSEWLDDGYGIDVGDKQTAALVNGESLAVHYRGVEKIVSISTTYDAAYAPHLTLLVSE